VIRTLLLALAGILALAAAPASAERVRDLGAFQSVRSNQLTGYGIVVGLDGSGDDNFAYLTQAMHGVSDRFGLQLPPGVNPALKNAAAVMITADLPAFAKPGPAHRRDRLRHRQGQEPARRGADHDPAYGADGQIYAMAQGSLAVGGLGVSGQDGSRLTVNIPTVGRIADGASVERAVATGFDQSEVLAGTWRSPIS
jgi:flagellar P-ring protein precursor FlgI